MGHPKLFRRLVRFAPSLALMVAASPVWARGDLSPKVICQIAFQ